jgi:hypothetical protein
MSIKNKTFAITGTLSQKREEIIELIKKHGGDVRSSVSSKVDYLIIADPLSNSIKAKNAKDLGITLLSESKFNKMILKPSKLKPKLPKAYHNAKDGLWYIEKNYKNLATGIFLNDGNDNKISLLNGILHNWTGPAVIDGEYKDYYLYGIPYDTYDSLQHMRDWLKIFDVIERNQKIDVYLPVEEMSFSPGLRFVYLKQTAGSIKFPISLSDIVISDREINYYWLTPQKIVGASFPYKTVSVSQYLQHNIYVTSINPKQLDRYRKDRGSLSGLAQNY